MANKRSTSNDSSLGGLSLQGLAAANVNEAARQAMAMNYWHNAGNQSGVRLFGDDMRGQEEKQQRGHTFERAQNKADEALARRQQAAREAAQAASRRLAVLERAARQKAEAEAEKRENADWFAKQQFQTDENIRQARAMMELEARFGDGQDDEDSDMPRLSDFGNAEFNPYRGQALSMPNRSEQFGLGDPHGYSEEEAEQVRALLAGEPTEVIPGVRDLFGRRSRAGSTALWDLGYRG